MSDIAVVILDIYDEDHVAFWVFAKLMQRIRGNFEKSQKAIKLQVNIKASVLLVGPFFQTIDISFYPNGCHTSSHTTSLSELSFGRP